MFKERVTEPLAGYSDPDGIKLYSIAFEGKTVNAAEFTPRLNEVKKQQGFDWATTPAFAIYHAGETRDYLIVCWWMQGNELFHSVSVKDQESWVEDPSRFSFCVYDLEIMWAERNFFIKAIDTDTPSLPMYQRLIYCR